MHILFQKMLERKKDLQKAQKASASILKKSPSGSIQVSSSHGSPQFYFLPPKGSSDLNPSKKYLSVKNSSLISALTNKHYAAKIYKQTTCELSLINRYLTNFSDHNAYTAYQELPAARRPYVTPLLQTLEEVGAAWAAEDYEKCTYMEENKIYESKRGIMVRSKSEALIDDMYLDLGIPNRYECALYTKRGVRYPDFTGFKVSTGELIYHEHFGLMDSEEYRQNCLQKLIEYMENGIYLGKNLIITFESEACPLRTKEIRKMLEAVFLDA